MSSANDATVERPIMSDEEIMQAAKEEWLTILSRLWTAVGKTPTPEQLGVYAEMLGDVPIGLLENAVKRSLRSHQYNSVPTIGNVWNAVMDELRPGNVPIPEAIDLWCAAKWEEMVYRFDAAVETES